MPEELSADQRAVLAAVCEALLPEIRRDDDPGGLFATGARATRTVDRAARLIATLRDPLDHTRLGMLLAGLGSAAANFVLTGRFKSLQAMDGPAREATLRDYANSSIPLRRAGFQALKRLVHVAFYCWPMEDGGHPAWRAAGYPGPLPQPAMPVAPLPTLTVDQDTTLDCDVIVLGSGAGGGVVAGLLAQAGRSVVVLEKGGNPGSADMTQVEGDMLGALYLDGGLLMTQSGSMPVLAGSCLGGGTVINYTTSFPPPSATREEWARLSGLPFFAGPRFEESLARVTRRLDVSTKWSTPGARDVILERGCRALGWHVDVIPRNVTGCKEGLECGYCTYGCRHGAKNSTARTYLADAAAAGARLVAHCEVERILAERGRATGAVATVRAPGGKAHTLRVRAPVVVAACGAINTPALLVRSGLDNRHIGQGLRLHPASAVAGIFPERVEPWTGGLQTRYSEQFADLHDGYGVRFETAPVHFALPASGFGWESAAQFKQDVARLGHLSIVGVLLRDRDAGRVETSREGRPRVHYEVSGFDLEHVRRGLTGAAQVLAAAGAIEVFSLHTPPARARPGESGWLERFGAAMDGRGYRHCRMSYITFHQMASCAMGADPARSVVGETGESHEVRGLYVADGSAFPTSCGVNPMITIMAVADHVARAILETR
ncbi:MAG TPA: GMC family oxidoreductase N-terminal domain-containing protein [Gemmatimonadales bacterium]|nr:GMC family oxidoreductase N-terminal domain-containing protein [Gemmatimonadales bacterium]